MCEFKVYIKKNGHENVVAEDIVYAKAENGSIILKGVLGDPVKVANATILEVDVEAERLVLTTIPTSTTVTATPHEGHHSKSIR